jgi:hypothetical protein
MGSSKLEARPSPVDLLVLGAGWTSQWLLPLAAAKGIKTAATTRDGRNGSLVFAFDPASDDSTPFEALPPARTILVSFPVKEKGGISKLVRFYNQTHGHHHARYIYLGSTGIWEPDNEGLLGKSSPFVTRHTPFNPANARGASEAELFEATDETTVLNLAGLWGGERSARRFLARIITSKEALAGRRSIHMINGEDVSSVAFRSRTPLD